jgi:hypothetical protein
VADSVLVKLLVLAALPQQVLLAVPAEEEHRSSQQVVPAVLAHRISSLVPKRNMAVAVAVARTTSDQTRLRSHPARVVAETDVDPPPNQPTPHLLQVSAAVAVVQVVREALAVQTAQAVVVALSLFDTPPTHSMHSLQASERLPIAM